MINLKNGLLPLSFFVCAYLLNTISACCQSGAIGVHGTLNEYAGDLNGDKYHFYNFDHPKPGGAISFQQYLNPSFNLVEKLSFNQVQYQNIYRDAGFDADLFTLNVKLKYKFNNGYILKEDATVSPFIVAGIGGAARCSEKPQNMLGCRHEQHADRPGDDLDERQDFH